MLKRFRSWHSGLSVLGKLAFAAALAIGIVGIVSASTHPNTPSVDNSSNNTATKTQPKVETQTTTETEAVPFTTSTVEDNSLDSGKTGVRTQGINGVKTKTYEVTYTDGVQTAKKLAKEEVTAQPVNQVNTIGTKVAATQKPSSNCDPNYDAAHGSCVPIASDVDCSGGSGNGPAYVSGPVYVIGSDIYGLDRDGDGVGCE
jgi:hypothetical protein